MNKTITIFISLICAAGLVAAFLAFNSRGEAPMQAHVDADSGGDNGCCMDPPCTMCSEEANEWNNFKIGGCKCAQLVALGKKPCSECQGGHSDESNECSLDAADGCKLDIDFNNF